MYIPSLGDYSLMTCVCFSLKEGTLNWEILQFKSKFPREVLLCRVCLVFVGHIVESFSSSWLCCLRENISSMWIDYLSLVNNGCTSVLFLQVGDFYEALGVDACILVEYAGLNPFGGLRSDSIPRAGCPVVVQNLCSFTYNIWFPWTSK